MTLLDPPDSMEPEKGFPLPPGGELSDIGDPQDYQQDIESDKGMTYMCILASTL